MKHDKYLFKIAWVFICIFLILIGYVVKFTIVDTEQLILHPANKRLDHLGEEVIRGTIYDALGNILAENQEGKRYYPYGTTYGHVVGYSQIGKYGVEAVANTQLLYPDYNFSSVIGYAFEDEKLNGHDVVLTLNHNLQSAISRSFEGKNGAAIVLEPSTGKILAMYSWPGFNPNDIERDWEVLSTNEEESPLLNRATQGLYPPASVFKIITTLAYLKEEGIEWDTEKYICTGHITIDGHTLDCYNQTAHGKIGLEEAFKKSCNTFFIQLSQQLSNQKLNETAKQVLFDQVLPVQFPYSESHLTPVDESGEKRFDELATYIGQGQILASPLHMAMLSGVIYNDGVLMQPYIVDYAMNQEGKEQFKNMPIYEGELLETVYTNQLKELMIGVVEEGTARSLLREDLIIGGKTGTAQNETPKDHSWFVGFAEGNSKPSIAFAIIVEQGGESAEALDVAKQMIDVYFK